MDDWRIQRKCAFLIHRSMPIETPVNIYEEIPLPFDDELKEQAEEEMNELVQGADEIYMHALKSGYFEKAI